MSFDEFRTLLAGLNGDTPLGAVVQIRSERDRKRINQFTPAQRKKRSEWAAFRAGKAGSVPVNREKYDAAMKNFAAMFRAMAGTTGGESNER